MNPTSKNFNALLADLRAEVQTAQMFVISSGGTGRNWEHDAKLEAFRTALKHAEYHAKQAAEETTEA